MMSFGEWVPQFVGNWLAQWQVAPWMQSLILDGIIAGVGAVLGFYHNWPSCFYV